MATSDVDQKYLGRLAALTSPTHPLPSKALFQLLGLSVILSRKLLRARRLRRLDPSRDTKSLRLYHHIVWLAREGLWILETYVLPTAQEGELGPEATVLALKLRASFCHVFCLFANTPPLTAVSLPGPRGGEATPPATPRKGRRTTPFLLPARNFIPLTSAHFATALSAARDLLPGAHPLRLSTALESTAFTWDVAHDHAAARRAARQAIRDLRHGEDTGIDDEGFDDAAELVGALGRAMRRRSWDGTPRAPGSVVDPAEGAARAVRDAEGSTTGWRTPGGEDEDRHVTRERDRDRPRTADRPSTRDGRASIRDGHPSTRDDRPPPTPAKDPSPRAPEQLSMRHTPSPRAAPALPTPPKDTPPLPQQALPVQDLERTPPPQRVSARGPGIQATPPTVTPARRARSASTPPSTGLTPPTRRGRAEALDYTPPGAAEVGILRKERSPEPDTGRGRGKLSGNGRSRGGAAVAASGTERKVLGEGGVKRSPTKSGSKKGRRDEEIGLFYEGYGGGRTLRAYIWDRELELDGEAGFVSRARWIRI
ncbi:hypothetical protein EJ06DRAFT_521146 [Trichodelitschia bisporula]|uniref:14-3-3 protein n=1 Tax=Trichodelitschia bisporula TaxID=703511 RepID=A0A6G1HZQ0_9PEZI|nr:hypothetical protein EJ06DRAFT_521146 [Trichodelitschia bisporula]